MTRKTQPQVTKAVPIGQPIKTRKSCIQIEDHSVTIQSAVDLFGLSKLRDPALQAGRLSGQFVRQNRSLLALIDATIRTDFDGRDVILTINSGSSVGAIPLISPTTAKFQYGLVIQPRFPWGGIGPMLAEMGWRVAPTPLRLPLLDQSERRVPLWVLSCMILLRLKRLLDSMERRFEFVSELRQAPRGTVDWASYATNSLPTAGFLKIPCSFPDLSEDRFLAGAIKFSAEKQLRVLETQRDHGCFVHRLIDVAQNILQTLRPIQPHRPSTTMLEAWARRPMRSEHLGEGLQAIEWTVDERGLAGNSTLEGIPWKMPMDQFFEAWVETIFQTVALRTGGRIKSGRKRETVHAIHWNPPSSGSQKSLVPDLWLEWDSTTLIVDAKYKRHWEELKRHQWPRVEELLREQHRHDLLQVLAYANLVRTPSAIVCLVYPCSPAVWASLCERGRLIHRAELTVAGRSLHLWLTAIPMAAEVDRVGIPIAAALRKILNGTNDDA